jgi:hemerythrin-like domain-containing protein
MDAIELLQRQHREASELLTAVQETKRVEDKTELFHELASLLVRHDCVERQIFYPACEQAFGTSELLGEPMLEHGVIEFCLYEADQALGTPHFDAKLDALGELLLQHMDDEERDLFSKARQALSPSRLESLGALLAREFEDAKQADYHEPLVDNLRQIWPVC